MVDILTRRVVSALFSFRTQVLCWASEEEKQEARLWVAAQSQCVEFGRGWSMVDGSLIPIAFKPGKKAYHREYFDRKGQYSFNLQAIVLPTSLRIIDFVAGYKGATQDSRAFAASDVVKRPRLYLDEGDFVWTDGGYGFSDHTCGPYDHAIAAKSSDFRKFNGAVSNVRVRSEHAFGYLKGRFQSLRGFRLLIRDSQDHTLAIRAVVAMMVAHNLALRWDGREERNVFVDLSSVSEEARIAWDALQQPNERQDQVESDAWGRRLRSQRAKMVEDRTRQEIMSQHGLDQARRQGGHALREELHVALFRSLNLQFIDTTAASRMKDKTSAELEQQLAAQEARLEQRRAARAERGARGGRGGIRGRGGRGGQGRGV
ncbi:unnamed protein product [Tilletia laevis]|uniref:DDE Tnp4 domain-containing protein n=2 Tax=Tilletia TaxID=13289 RepID=A0A9N8LM00_9BASI|nr:unnamed protein product [Tilletia laevis]